MNIAFKVMQNMTHKEKPCKKKDITVDLSIDYLGKHRVISQLTEDCTDAIK